MTVLQPQSLACTTPEDLLRVRPDAPKGLPIDAINAACERANSVLMLLSAQFDSDNDSRFSDAIIASVIWDVQGTIEQIRTIASYANECAIQARREGGKA